MASEIEKKPVFMVCPIASGGLMFNFGITEEAWATLSGESNTFHFDMMKATGIPIGVQIIRAKDHDEIMRIFHRIAGDSNVIIDDRRREEFGITPSKETSHGPEEASDAQPEPEPAP